MIAERPELDASAVPQYVQVPLVPVQGTSTPLQYGLILLRYALAYGCTDFSTEQLKLADHAYPYALYRYGKDRDAVAYVNKMTILRHRILAQLRGVQAAREARDAMLAAWLAENDQTSPAGQDGQESTVQEQADPRDVALRLMRAALQMIQHPDGGQDDSGNGGGSRVPVVPKSPKFPPSGAYATPNDKRPPINDIDF